MVGAVIGGVLLGPLAFLIFFVNPERPQNKKCAHCAEWIKAEATVCKHCHRPVADARSV